MQTPQDFFYAHAGYSYDPKAQTEEQGRRECAQRLADAEDAFINASRVADVGIDWADDDDCGGYRKGKDYAHTCETAVIWHRDGAGEVHYLACLGGITDADANYRRVIRAEMALECLDELRKLAGA